MRIEQDGHPIVFAAQVYVAELDTLVTHPIAGDRVSVRLGDGQAVVYLAGTLPELTRFSHAFHDAIVAAHKTTTTKKGG